MGSSQRGIKNDEEKLGWITGGRGLDYDDYCFYSLFESID